MGTASASGNGADPPLLDDECGGFRESSCGGVYFAAMQGTSWDPNYDYKCPDGYVWMTADEFNQNKAESTTCRATFVYAYQCGFSRYDYPAGTWQGYVWRFADHATNNVHAESGVYDNSAL